jgi:hypothetical protein
VNVDDETEDDMITWVRTAGIQEGKMNEAFTWAVKVAAYLNKKFKGMDVQVMRNVGGPLYQVHWVCNYESLGAFEKRWKEVESDRGYNNLLSQIRKKGAFIGSSVVDSFYESVS